MLKSLKVEMLLLSAIPHLVDTWTSGFGFRGIDDSDVGIDRRFMVGSIVGTCWDRPSALRSAQTLNLTQQTEEEDDEQ
jgi:hypothetical protein